MLHLPWVDFYGTVWDRRIHLIKYNGGFFCFTKTQNGYDIFLLFWHGIVEIAV